MRPFFLSPKNSYPRINKSKYRDANQLNYRLLEPRLLMASLRIGAWNTGNGPNNPTDDSYFSTVVEAIGYTEVLGDARSLDILAVAETDTGSASRLEQIFDSVYPNEDYAVVTSTADGGGDRTGFVYNRLTVSLLEAFELPSPLITHNLLRGMFQPIGGSIADVFYVYAVHLKAGTGSSNEQIRAVESQLVRQDADQLGEGANILYVGDFNLYDSDELAWTELIASGPGAATDVADALGAWDNNPAFKHLHTQSPSVVDSRFDFIFASEELRDGVGIDYVQDSFTILGNNGTHLFDGPIDSGNGAPPEVLAAIREASDHLPIFSDFELNNSGSQTIIPDSLTVVAGSLASGGLVELASSDDAVLAARSTRQRLGQAPTVTLEFGSSASVGAVQSLLFRVEARANTPNLQQKIYLFDFASLSFGSPFVFNSTLSDSIAEISIGPEFAANFIQPGTGQVRARIEWVPSGPVLFQPWTISVDHVTWSIGGSSSVRHPDNRYGGAGRLDDQTAESPPVAFRFASAPVFATVGPALGVAADYRTTNIIPSNPDKRRAEPPPERHFELHDALFGTIHRETEIIDKFLPRRFRSKSFDAAFAAAIKDTLSLDLTL